MFEIPDGDVSKSNSTSRKISELSNYEVATRINSISVSDSNKLSQELAGLTKEMDEEISQVFKDGKVDDKEFERLDTINGALDSLHMKIKETMRNANESVQSLYKNLANQVIGLINKIDTASNGKNPTKAVKNKSAQNPDAPLDTDNESLRWSTSQKYVKTLYENVLKNERPQLIANKLEELVQKFSGRFNKTTEALSKTQERIINKMIAKYSEQANSEAIDTSGIDPEGISKKKQYELGFSQSVWKKAGEAAIAAKNREGDKNFEEETGIKLK